MPLFKDMMSKQKKSKSLHLTGEMLARRLQGNGINRNSFTAIPNEPNDATSRKLSRSSSYADNEAVLLNVVAREDIGSVKRVLENGKVDINVVRNGFSPLHHACVNGNMHVVKLLIKHKVDVNLKTTNGKTPIKLAVMNGHFELAEFLISNGSQDSDIVDGVQ